MKEDQVTTEDLSNAQIVAGLKAKDDNVFAYIYQKYGHMISGHVVKNSGSQEDAKEMIQITMLKLWLAIKENRYKEEGKLEHYIFQITANSWREELRRRRNKPQTKLEDQAFHLKDQTEEDMLRVLVKEKRLNAIHQALGQLKEQCRSIIHMYYLKKVSLLEISEQLSYNYNNLRKRIFDCRKKLKRIVGTMVDL